MSIDVLFNGVGWTDIALTLNRAAVGTFFMISGHHKLFNAQRHHMLVNELEALHIPAVGINQWWVPTIEFSAGGAVLIGLLTPLAARAARDNPRRERHVGATASQSLQTNRQSGSDRRLALFARDGVCIHADHGALGWRGAI